MSFAYTAANASDYDFHATDTNQEDLMEYCQSKIWKQNCKGWNIEIRNRSDSSVSFISRRLGNIQRASRVIAPYRDGVAYGDYAVGIPGFMPTNVKMAYKTDALNDNDWHRFVDIKSDKFGNVTPACGVTQYDGPFDFYLNRQNGVGCKFIQADADKPIIVEFTNPEKGFWSRGL